MFFVTKSRLHRCQHHLFIQFISINDELFNPLRAGYGWNRHWNGLSLVKVTVCRRSAPSHHINFVDLLLSGTWRTNNNEILIKPQILSMKKMFFELSSAKWWPFYSGLNMATHLCQDKDGDGISQENLSGAVLNRRNNGTSNKSPMNVTLRSQPKINRVLIITCGHIGNDPFAYHSSASPVYFYTGPLFTKRIARSRKSRRHEIGCYNYRIALKFDMHFDSAAAEVPVKF